MDVPQRVEFLVQLPSGADIDDTDLENLTNSLKSELDELPFVRDVARVATANQGAGLPPKGTKGGEIVTLAALGLAILPAAIPQIIEFLKEWILRPGNRPLKIKVEGGSGSLEIEYDPRTMATDEVTRLVSAMRQMLATQGRKSTGD